MFDIILLHTISRLDPYYLNIVKELGHKLSIGIYFGMHRNTIRTLDTDSLFISKCEQFGASILKEEQVYTSKLLFVHMNTVATEERMAYAMKHIRCENIIVMQVFNQAKGCLKRMKELHMKELWIYGRRVLEVELEEKNQESLLKDFKITDIELPYQKYPAIDFTDLEIDYIIALPSGVSMKNIDDIAILFANLRKLLEIIPKEKTVYIKQHNVRDVGSPVSEYFDVDDSHLLMRHIYRMIRSSRLRDLSIRNIKGKFMDYQRFRRTLDNISFVEKRATLLSEKTKYYNFSIEHFLPFVKEGVITGISSCTWHSIYNRLPVYNCDGKPFNSEIPNYHVLKNYYVPPCNGRLAFDVANYDLVESAEKKKDMIDMIEKEVSRR